MINDYLRGRACIESVRGSLIQGEFLILTISCSFYFGFEIFLAHLCLFAWFATFRAFVGLAVFLLLDDLVELLLAFWSSSYASWGFGFEIQTLCFLLSTDSSRGRLRNQVVSSLV
jgi:hypothetical protein